MIILIVEDETELAESIKTFIDKEGFNCEAVGSFYSAKNALHINSYGLALIDIILPDRIINILLNKIRQVNSTGKSKTK